MKTLLLFALLLVPTLAFAEGVVVKQSTCMITWTAPQVNADGTPLADLKEYGVYLGPSPASLTAPVAVVAAPAPDPATGATASLSCKGLAPGQYYAGRCRRCGRQPEWADSGRPFRLTGRCLAPGTHRADGWSVNRESCLMLEELLGR